MLCSRFQECLWGSERKVADVDTQGVEDPKLFVWPGKGVYAVFGRKPEALGASPYCKDPIFVQFLVQVSGPMVGRWDELACLCVAVRAASSCACRLKASVAEVAAARASVVN